MPGWVHSDPHDDNYWAEDGAQKPCARGEYCVNRDHDGNPALGPRVLCANDRAYLIKTINRIPEVYLELYLMIGDKGGVIDGPRVSGGGKNPPIPLRADVDALMRSVIDVISSWDERIRTVMNLSEQIITRRRQNGFAMGTTCEFIAKHVDTLLSLEPAWTWRSVDVTRTKDVPKDAVSVVHDDAGWLSYETEMSGADAAIELFALFSRCQSKLGHTPRHQDLLTPCQQCDQRMLRRWDGAAGLEDHVECRSCGTRYLGEDLAKLMEEEEAVMKKRSK
jgi:hypothetical protein